jgi:hypothetical protein
MTVRRRRLAPYFCRSTPKHNTVHLTATSWAEVLVPAAEWPAIRLALSPYFPEPGFGASVRVGVYNRLMFLSELIDLRIRESPPEAPHFSFSFGISLLRAPFEPNLGGRRDSVTTSLQKPLAGPANIVKNGPARSQITICGAEVKRAEIGRLPVNLVRKRYAVSADLSSNRQVGVRQPLVPDKSGGCVGHSLNVQTPQR